MMNDPKILELKDGFKRTVAHEVSRHPELAQKMLQTPDRLKLSNYLGWSVAHEIALRHASAGYGLLKDINIALLTDKRGITVADIVKRTNLHFNKDVLDRETVHIALLGVEVRKAMRSVSQ